ncbi:MAG: hypothetical protein KME26_03685 [Oscillatoria princeps RMCB-10]|jgi:hypothetical protein|nr:hypothetical protein [Oscillatoria princeps RMCB-10]
MPNAPSVRYYEYSNEIYMSWVPVPAVSERATGIKLSYQPARNGLLYSSVMVFLKKAG